jgi:transcriptional regulator PpsR
MVSNTVSGEFVKSWLGRPWIETVADSGVDKVRSSLDDALSGGVSAYRRIVQRFPSGLELPIEYTTVRLAESGGMIAVGRNLQASSELQSRLIAAQQAMERDYWKLREVETRYRLLFDASTEAVLVLNSDDLRVTEANPAAIRALGLTRGWDFLDEMAPPEREAFRAMLDRVREGGRAPGGIFHIGARQAPWIVRASSMSDDGAAFYMVQLVPAEGQRALAAPERGANAAVGSSRAEASVGGDPGAGHAPSIATVGAGRQDPAQDAGQGGCRRRGAALCRIGFGDHGRQPYGGRRAPWPQPPKSLCEIEPLRIGCGQAVRSQPSV